MIKQTLFIIAFAVTSFSIASDQITVKLLHNKAEDGKIVSTLKSTFRGGVKILDEVTKTNLNSPNQRIFFYEKKPKMIESDYDHDGHYEQIIILGEDITNFEAFNRSKNGVISALKPKEYQKIVQRNRKIEREINKKLRLNLKKTLKELKKESGEPTSEHLKKNLKEK